ncbi:MAG: hypothetical protein GX198_02920 [Epulopiscium sp.]|nr:hypothetical protein [Candidatus Epulonipiscium sp.]
MNKSNIWFVPKVIGIWLLFVVFPVINQVLAKLMDKEEQITHFIYGTMFCGVLLTLFFAVLLMLTYNREKTLRKYFMRRRRTRIETRDGYYQCLYCGNEMVKQEDIICSVCGVRFL